MHSSENRPLWTITEALELCRRVIPVLKDAGFSVGLTGSLIRQECSQHDVDLIVYPFQSSQNTDFSRAKATLEKFGMKPVYNREQVTAHWRKKGSLDEKWVEIWDFNGKRVDVFFMR